MQQFIKISPVRQRVHELGKISSPGFESYVNRLVDETITSACRVHNGGRKRLDETVAAHAVRLPSNRA